MRFWGLLLIVLGLMAPGNAVLAKGPDSDGSAEPTLHRRQNEAAIVEIILPRDVELAPSLGRALHEEAEATVAGFTAEAEAEQERRKSEQPNAEPVPFSLSVTYRPTMVSAEVISLLKVIDLFTGGAHGAVEFEGIIFDRRRQGIVGAEQILNGGEGWLANVKRLTALAAEALRVLKSERLGGDYEASGGEGWLDDFQLPLQSMTLLPSDDPGKIGGVAFDFAPYAAGSFAEGIYRVVLPAAQIEPMAGAAWRHLFGGQPNLLTYVPTSNPNDGHFALIRKPQARSVVGEKIAISGEAPAPFFEGEQLPVRVLRHGEVLSEGVIGIDRKVRPSGTAVGMIPFSGTIDAGRGNGEVLIRLGRKAPVDIPVVIDRKR